MSNLDFENEIWDLNYSYICGLDEGGRGCLAGPVYSGAVVLKKDQNTDDALFKKINDSKNLTENSRESLVQYIKDISIDTAIGICTNEEIDDLGIQSAVKTSMNRAINNLNVSPDYLLVDSLKLDNKIPQKNIIRGDQASKSIAAASIIAKVARDKFMVQDLSEKFPNYYFNKNKGYGTKVHMEAIKEFGITNSHRKSFEPIKSMLKG